jgi:hypothetical protein
MVVFGLPLICRTSDGNAGTAWRKSFERGHIGETKEVVQHMALGGRGPKIVRCSIWSEKALQVE